MTGDTLIARRKRRVVEEIPLSSTSDIAFLLIVFFLAASALLEMRGVELPLPRKDAPPMQILKENLYKVKVNAAGALMIDGEAVELDEMRRDIQERRTENPELVVSVRVHADAPAQAVPGILQMLREIRMQQISLGIDRETM